MEKYRRTLELGEQVYLSAVVYYEIKRGLLHLGAAKQLRQLDHDFKDVLYWAPVSDATWDRTRRLFLLRFQEVHGCKIDKACVVSPRAS